MYCAKIYQENICHILVCKASASCIYMHCARSIQRTDVVVPDGRYLCLNEGGGVYLPYIYVIVLDLAIKLILCTSRYGHLWSIERRSIWTSIYTCIVLHPAN